MKATRTLLRHYFYFSLICFLWVLVSAQNSSATPPNVLEAINVCRSKLKEDPHFPRIQHSLAQLLDSQISPSDIDTALVSEVLQLYHAVGQPSPEVAEKRLPPAKVRFESLARAGTIAKDILHDTPQATKYFSLALKLDGVEDSSILLAFETIMPHLISSVKVDHPVTSDDAHVHQQTQIIFDLCNIVGPKCPKATVVDEYKGALLRRLKEPGLAYQSYRQAVVKSKQNLISEEVEYDQNSNEYVDLIANFVTTSILAAAAGREAGDSFQQQMNYLMDAEKVAIPLLEKTEGMEEQTKDSFRDHIVDLYNNMGIAEKKQGSLKRARGFFRQAFEINPKDGHSLAQLASVDDGNNDVDDVVSNARELDLDYVAQLFDGYSTRFESELVDVLGYNGHNFLYDAAQKALKQLGKSPMSIKKIIDLGCGTGLLGEIVANEMPWVEVLGVDLSQRMVEISRARKSSRGGHVYASVSNDDAVTYLSSLEKHSLECILASDVFIYLGDLSKVLLESSRCLVGNGILGFTIENYQDPNADNGMRLQKSGRFGHSKSYIYEVAKMSGFEVLSWEDCVLRQQANVDVSGAIIVLRKI